MAMRNLRRTTKISGNQEGIQVLQEQYIFWELTYSTGSELHQNSLLVL